MKSIHCLRCDKELLFLKREKLQLGQTGFLLGDWPNLLAGSLESEIYYCPKCGKLEFYLPDFKEEKVDEPDIEICELPPESEQNIVGVSMSGVPQVQCPACGHRHDFDYPRCPKCDHPY